MNVMGRVIPVLECSWSGCIQDDPCPHHAGVSLDHRVPSLKGDAPAILNSLYAVRNI